MIIEAVTLIAGLTFSILAFGYWMKSKAIMFGGASMLLLLGGLIMLPDVYNGGIDYVSGSQMESIQNSTNISASEYSINGTTKNYATYSHVDPAATSLLGLNLLLLAVYMMMAVWFEEKMD